MVLQAWQACTKMRGVSARSTTVNWSLNGEPQYGVTPFDHADEVVCLGRTVFNQNSHAHEALFKVSSEGVVRVAAKLER